MSMNEKSCLIVYHFSKFIPKSGGVIDLLSISNELANKQFTVDLLCVGFNKCLDNEILELKENGFENIYFVKRNKFLFCWLFGVSFNSFSRKNLAKIYIKTSYEFVLLYNDVVGKYFLKNKSINFKKIYLRVANNESKYFLELASSVKSIFKKIYFKCESYFLKKESEQLFKQVDKLFFISNVELMYYCDTFKNAIYLPPFFNVLKEGNYLNYSNNSNNVLFIGTLFNHLNIHGIKWYINNVHKIVKLKVPLYKLIIAGNSGATTLDWLNDIADEAIEIIDTPKNLKPLYEKAVVFINPMQNGAGVKLKTLEAIAYGVPVVSTFTGVEGLTLEDGVHFLLANTPIDYAECIVKILTNRDFGFKLLNDSQKFLVRTSEKNCEIFLN